MIFSALAMALIIVLTVVIAIPLMFIESLVWGAILFVLGLVVAVMYGVCVVIKAPFVFIFRLGKKK